MATITKSIGTSSRDYSTITAWEADLDNTGIYTSGDDAVGECYNDSDFTESVTINGGATVGLNSLKLSVASGERHDGTQGTGARILGAYTQSTTTVNGNFSSTIEWLDLDGNSQLVSVLATWTSTAIAVFNNLLIHDVVGNGNNYNGILANGIRDALIKNCIVYNNSRDGSASTKLIFIDGERSGGGLYNNTCYNSTNTGAGEGIGIYVATNSSNFIVKNNLCVGDSDFSGFVFTGTDTVSDYNLSSDDSADDAGGSNNIINATTANQFASTVSGSEDLHIVSTSDAVGAGEDLATTSIDINGSDRNALAATVWDIGAHQYASTASIGTSSRDYSTITLWEADLDDTTIYGAGANAVGECYNDAAFVERIVLDGGITVGLNTTILTVAAGERHDGTAGTGARVETPSNWGRIFYFSNDNIPTRLEWLEFENLHATANGMIDGAAYDYYKSISKLLVHSTTNHPPGYINLGFWQNSIDNCIVYAQGATTKNAITIVTYYSVGDIVNNTVYLGRTGINVNDNPTSKAFVKNNIAISQDTNYEGFNVDSATSFPNWDSNITNGSVSYGANMHTGITASQLFVSVVSGSEDLHLKSDSYAIGKGANLSSVGPSQPLNTVISSGYSSRDIDNQNRSAFTGTTWDIGADQVKTPASIGTSSRDYSTITAWEADLDDTSLYTSGDDAVGECYNDAAFVESFALDGGSTLGLSSVLLKPASGEGHDGTADTGVKVESYAYGQAKWYNTTTIPSEIRQIDFKRQHNSEQVMISLANLNSVINRCIVRNVSGSPFRSHINTGFSGGSVYNSILYGYTMKYGIEFQSLYSGYVNIINNTIYAATNAYGCVYGRNRNGTADTSIFKNNLLITQGSAVAYDPANTVPSSFADNKNNMTNYSSFPSTHFDSSSITNVDSSKQFVSTLSGSEDLHLIFKSAAIDAGVDLGTTPDGVQYDINGKDRDTENSIWDIGAHEYGDNVIFGLLRV